MKSNSGCNDHGCLNPLLFFGSSLGLGPRHPQTIGEVRACMSPSLSPFKHSPQYLLIVLLGTPQSYSRLSWSRGDFVCLPGVFFLGKSNPWRVHSANRKVWNESQQNLQTSGYAISIFTSQLLGTFGSTCEILPGYGSCFSRDLVTNPPPVPPLSQALFDKMLAMDLQLGATLDMGTVGATLNKIICRQSVDLL